MGMGPSFYMGTSVFQSVVGHFTYYLFLRVVQQQKHHHHQHHDQKQQNISDVLKGGTVATLAQPTT
jgi:hypothetical protein